MSSSEKGWTTFCSRLTIGTRMKGFSAAVLAIIALGIGIYEISNISSVFPLLEDPSLYPPDLGRYPVTVGSGLCLTVFGGLMAAFGGILEAIRVRPQALDQAE